jgi:hypothetical protein
VELERMLATDPLARESAELAKNVFVGPTQAPLALNGRRTTTIALRRIEDLALAAPQLVSPRSLSPCRPERRPTTTCARTSRASRRRAWPRRSRRPIPTSTSSSRRSLG